MRHSALILMLGLAGCAASGDIPGDYRLIAVEGVAVSGSPSLRIEKDGAVSGQGPCNRFSGQNQAKLPALDLGALRPPAWPAWKKKARMRSSRRWARCARPNAGARNW